MSFGKNIAKIGIALGALIGAVQVGEHYTDDKKEAAPQLPGEIEQKKEAVDRERVEAALETIQLEKAGRQSELAKKYSDQLSGSKEGEGKELATKVLKDYKKWAYGYKDDRIVTLTRIAEYINENDVKVALGEDAETVYSMIEAAKAHILGIPSVYFRDIGGFRQEPVNPEQLERYEELKKSALINVGLLNRIAKY